MKQIKTKHTSQLDGTIPQSFSEAADAQKNRVTRRDWWIYIKHQNHSILFLAEARNLSANVVKGL